MEHHNSGVLMKTCSTESMSLFLLTNTRSHINHTRKRSRNTDTSNRIHTEALSNPSCALRSEFTAGRESSPAGRRDYRCKCVHDREQVSVAQRRERIEHVHF